MKKIIPLLFLLVTFNAGNLIAQNVPIEHGKFISSFTEAIQAHNEKKVIKLMDKEYRKEQIALLEGRKEQFLNELFGGQNANSEDYINIRFNDIQTIEVAQVIALKDGGYTYIFRIKDGTNDILSSLSLKKNGKKYGFVGSRG
jgi:hypothetical protein